MTHTTARDAQYAGIMTIMYTLAAIAAVLIVATAVAPDHMAALSAGIGAETDFSVAVLAGVIEAVR